MLLASSLVLASYVSRNAQFILQCIEVGTFITTPRNDELYGVGGHKATPFSRFQVWLTASPVAAPAQ